MTSQTETCYRHPDETTRIRCTRCGRPICTECMTPAPVGHQCPACVSEGGRTVGRRRLRLPRPRSMVMVILGINVGVFVLQTVLGGSQDVRVLVTMGAMWTPAVAAGEYWRLMASMFLHIGVAHLLLNSLGLYIFGSLVEQVFGWVRFLALYLVTGFVAGATSYAFGGVKVAAGASGAIFGLLGVWLVFNFRRRSLGMARANVQGALLLIGLNLVIGFTIAGIDNLAHIGGLVAGVIAGFAAEGVGRRRVRVASQILGLAGLTLLGVALVAWRTATFFPAVA